MLSILMLFSGQLVEMLSNTMNEEWGESVDFYVFEKV